MSFRLLPLFLSLASAAKLYATHYDGNVYSLSLDRYNGNYSLTVASSLKACGEMPSWVTYDADDRILYCSDESGDVKTQSSLSAFTAAEDGKLTQTAKAKAVGAGVDSVIYNGTNGDQYIAIANYGAAGISTFALPLEDNSKILQTVHYNLTSPGPEAQQTASHPHQVFLDPTGDFLLSPDLGADSLRVHSIDKKSGKLNTCPSLKFPAGSGPRRGVFWTEKPSPLRNQLNNRNCEGKTLLYTVDELDSSLHVFDVTHNHQSGCLGFKKLQTMVPYPKGELPKGATLSELRLVGDNLYVSIRTDHGFAPNDSISTLTRAANGTVAFKDSTSSYGTVPRTMAINKAGDLIAVGNQASSNVAIVKRDVKTGKLGGKVADVAVGTPGKVGSAQGLSSIVWAE
ncbi:hypothetical protein ASPWEDRAFT_720992 [Aspergillus wentii DTO 134E9]|uniref:6-phosphogluconolactonase n=1 Tax=Aspergillus wentii DTO 134E9 TaxID=1073089 RepID=A0A1L9R6W0_ASPWE|nr:uncharacterized protein ASPWEDRAFT_720992 [Aspergillus wentii DTO 134E9]KAI9926710.1 hypothetical protein MW887_003804 [Aspergillus wentii]OJJ30627.1 hypothetical protein ASPWEDRAFT_720992 [Aspergillus wentii DTO 134E9]